MSNILSFNIRCKRVYLKAANHWTVVLIKKPKTYSYISELLAKIGIEYCKQEKPLRLKVELQKGHPKLITATIAPQSPPPTAEIQARKIPRIKENVKHV